MEECSPSLHVFDTKNINNIEFGPDLEEVPGLSNRIRLFCHH